MGQAVHAGGANTFSLFSLKCDQKTICGDDFKEHNFWGQDILTAAIHSLSLLFLIYGCHESLTFASFGATSTANSAYLGHF